MFEYKSIDLPLNEDPAAVLNEHGKEGWVCCGMVRVPRNEVAVGGEFLRVVMVREATVPVVPLGDVVQTNRGYELIRFEDHYGAKCSVQQSSATDGRSAPGQSYLWIGVDDAEPKIKKTDARRLGLKLPEGEVSGWMPFEIPEDVSLTTRIHVGREQVAGLVSALYSWLETGSLGGESLSVDVLSEG